MKYLKIEISIKMTIFEPQMIKSVLMKKML